MGTTAADIILGKKKKKDNLPKKNTKMIKTTQQTLPYVEAYENGVIQTDPGLFTKTYEFEDISFKTCSEEQQEEIYQRYQKFLNSLDAKEDVFFTIVNSHF